MSTLEETIKNTTIEVPIKVKSKESIFSRFLGLLCSVRFGIILLILLGLACFLGMVIMQQNVDGFERYYANLTPSEKTVYGALGLFDIYHSWYFITLLGILSINIVLSSIDRFPKTWHYIKKPVLTPPLRWLKDQDEQSTFEIEGENKKAVTEKVSESLKKSGWKNLKINEKNGKTFIFTESGVWNRFGYLAVHVGLLIIFVGGFMTSQLGHTGNLPLTPGQTQNLIFETEFGLDQVQQVTKRLPFEITCTDIQQKLIKNDGSINAMNTIDWLTKVQIKDEGQVHDAVVQMNRPFDYRGYRFFQASFVPVGRARNITVRATDANGQTQDVQIQRNGSTTLSDGTKVRFVDFRANFSLGQEDPNEDTSSYENPGATLEITPVNGSSQTAYAFGEKMASIPVADKMVGGYKFKLVDFEKVGDQHILSVQYDPGVNVVYLGFIFLFITLVAVFFFAHKRIWAAIEETSDNKFEVTISGNTNRNQNAFQEQFKQFINSFQKGIKEA
ncbi:MAG: cytochrome c biogenesis protein ResB [Pyrinomonadaceae bacterium]|nr:cytochrome c biogenesis protein ResB [Pyrinomonadaceae bacterium]